MRIDSPSVVVMGVAGSGKTTIGVMLAARLGLPFAEADDFHPVENRAKMAAGHPLDDADREPWLASLASWIASHPGGVLTCSALKLRYRDVLRADRPGVWFLCLSLSPVEAAARVAARTGHFMPASLVRSQFADLEPLAASEAGLTIEASQDPDVIVSAALRALDVSGR